MSAGAQADRRIAADQRIRGGQRIRPGLAARDALVVAGRDLRKIPRIPELLVFSVIQPVMFVLLFRYVFGGAIHTSGSYVDYLMPGIFVQTVAFGGVATGVGLTEDLSKGIIDRFRSLPMARSAVLLGRTLSDLVRNIVTVAIMVGVGVGVGFRFGGGVGRALAGFAIILVFAFSFSWIGATIGLFVRSTEAANTAGFVWLFPLTFASSAFVPLTSMPGWLQAFAAHTPVTYTVDAARALLAGRPIADSVVASLAWSAGILAVFVPLAVTRYRRSISR